LVDEAQGIDRKTRGQYPTPPPQAQASCEKVALG